MNRPLFVGAMGAVIVVGAIALTMYFEFEPGARPHQGTPETRTSVAPAAPGAATEVPAPAASEPRLAAPEISKEPIRPSFDIVRVNREGDAVIAGRAAPDAEVTVTDGETTPEVDFFLGPGTMLVDSIDVSVSKKGRNTQAEASVEIVDQDSNPVLGANVTGDWYLQNAPFSSGAAGTTGYFGYATISSGKIENSSRGDVIKFCVTSVTHDILSYDPTANIPNPPCGQTTVP